MCQVKFYPITAFEMAFLDRIRNPVHQKRRGLEKQLETEIVPAAFLAALGTA
jgi:hypothetical protein